MRNLYARRFRHRWTTALHLYCTGRDASRMLRRAHVRARRYR